MTLKVCPFCANGDPRLEYSEYEAHAFYRCRICWACGPEVKSHLPMIPNKTPPGSTSERAIEAWNNRKERVWLCLQFLQR